jgi:hypothetical protein
MLKKQACYLIAIVSVAVLFLGCNSISKAMSTGKIVFDPDVPEEQSIVVTFDDTIIVLRFNGVDVKKAWYPNDKTRVNKVTLPAGPAVITLNYAIMVAGEDIYTRSSWVPDGGTYTIIERNNIELRFDFEAGTDYAIGAYSVKGESRGKWTYGIGVWNKASDIGDKEKAVKAWDLVER